MENLIKIGFSSSAHGIKGAANFNNLHMLGAELEKGDRLFLFPTNEKSNLDTNGKLYILKKVNYGHKIMIELEGINNRNELEEILPFDIKIERPILDDGEFLIEDLIGFDVLSSIDKKRVGEIVGFYDNGMQQVLEIKGEIEIDLPFIENFFPEVNISEKNMIMIVPEIIEDEKK